MKQIIRKNIGIILIIVLIITLASVLAIKIKKGNNTKNHINSIEPLKNINSIKDEKYIVEYSVPEKFELKEEFIETTKTYTNNESIIIKNTIKVSTEDEYLLQEQSNYEFYKSSNYYNSVELSSIQNINIENKEFKYQTLICKSNSAKIQNMNIWYKIDDNYIFCVEVEINNYNVELDESIIEEIQEFLTINIQEI